MIKSLNVYVGQAADFKKNNGASVIENMAAAVLRQRGATGDLSMRRLPGGKPVFEHLNLHFNGSHSGGLAAVVFDDAPIGIDLQQIGRARPMAHYDKIARRFFHPKEWRYLAALPEDARRQAFFEIWSQKEAVMKQTGKGFALPMNAFYVDGAGAYRDGRCLPLVLVPCAVGADFVCFVAVNQKKNTSAHQGVIVSVEKVSVR